MIDFKRFIKNTSQRWMDRSWATRFTFEFETSDKIWKGNFANAFGRFASRDVEQHFKTGRFKVRRVYAKNNIFSSYGTI